MATFSFSMKNPGHGVSNSFEAIDTLRRIFEFLKRRVQKVTDLSNISDVLTFAAGNIFNHTSQLGCRGLASFRFLPEAHDENTLVDRYADGLPRAFVHRRPDVDRCSEKYLFRISLHKKSAATISMAALYIARFNFRSHRITRASHAVIRRGRNVWGWDMFSAGD